MAYWNFYLDHRKPVWQDFLAGIIFPIMAPISILGAGCTDPNIKGNPLIPFPKTEPTGTDASDSRIAPSLDGFVDAFEAQNLGDRQVVTKAEMGRELRWAGQNSSLKI